MDREGRTGAYGVSITRLDPFRDGIDGLRASSGSFTVYDGCTDERVTPIGSFPMEGPPESCSVGSGGYERFSVRVVSDRRSGRVIRGIDRMRTTDCTDVCGVNEIRLSEGRAVCVLTDLEAISDWFWTLSMASVPSEPGDSVKYLTERAGRKRSGRLGVGFISLDCGLIPKSTTYTEKTTNITYTSDTDYIDSGLVGRINDLYNTPVQQQTWTLRSFPEGQRNCYNFNLKANRKYLIRGTFVYGNYDGLNQIPKFDLHIGPNKWTSVILVGVANASIYEMIHVLPQDRLEVCLVKTGQTTPFISALELRPLNNRSYVTQSGSLVSFARIYFPQNPSYLRYDEDFHDRVWVPYRENETLSISTNLPVDTSSNSYDVPQNVANSAIIPAKPTDPLNIWWDLGDAKTESYIYMHFAEIQNLGDNEIREFNITYNGDQVWETFFRPGKLNITTIISPTALNSPDGIFNFTFTMTKHSTLPPLINALEVYTVVENLLLAAYQDEVSAMMNIKKTYGLSKKISWQGDPCSPQIYRWEGVNCLHLDSDQPLIISLNLTTSGLNGTISPDIANLIQLRELDLSKNDLSGDIPHFLADMKMLALINLSGNPKLNLTIPDSLQQKINNKSITLIIDDKLGRKFTLVTVEISVAGVITALAILTICFIVARKKHNKVSSSVNSEKRSSNQSIGTKERIFTYSEILKMTNNFERVLGKGGYGRVYYGNLNDTQVAVKMLFHTSAAQDYKHFKAEVELLVRVHHRHLVRLVGYCDDGDNLALIYEYMANGDLKENMSGKCGEHVLTWENRMLIAMEAAQGLEYLHNGSIPPMVHRDVKTTNILLNELFQAKLADFGLSRSSPVDGESYVSTIVAGTPGYLDPEYYITNLLSEKSDVYSFGVVLLEIITNQPVIDTTREKSHITQWVGFVLLEGDIKSIIDPKLMGDFDTNGVWKAVELALACVNPISNRRPTMPHVVMELKECLDSEIARKQGSQVMYSKNSVDFSLSPGSELSPGPRLLILIVHWRWLFLLLHKECLGFVPQRHCASCSGRGEDMRCKGEGRGRQEIHVRDEVRWILVATGERMREVADLILVFPEESPVIVLSAMGKTTNNLLLAGEKAVSCGVSNASEIEELSIIKELHLRTVAELKIDPHVRVVLFVHVTFVFGRTGATTERHSHDEGADSSKQRLLSLLWRVLTSVKAVSPTLTSPATNSLLLDQHKAVESLIRMSQDQILVTLLAGEKAVSCGVSNASEIEELSIIKELHLRTVAELKIDPHVRVVLFVHVTFVFGRTGATTERHSHDEGADSSKQRLLSLLWRVYVYKDFCSLS
ncbi:Leucine-rich repeat protein kinase family protein [Hirschfeldia incana]|nr:Leucine-rich repeat protein kinase family protein [Hirschfeldia incana]